MCAKEVNASLKNKQTKYTKDRKLRWCNKQEWMVFCIRK